MSRHAIFTCGLALICVAVLGTRVYLTFDRVRVHVITTPVLADGAPMSIDLPVAWQLSRQPSALIFRVRGGAEPTALAMRLDGREFARAVIPAHREVRIDTSIGPVAAARHALTLVAPQAGWTLTSLEIANVHGHSSGLATLVVTPRGRTALEQVLPPWMLVPVFAMLVGLRPRLDWPTHRGRYLHRFAMGLVLLLFGLTLLAPLVSEYRVLLSVRTFVLAAAVLYAEPILRAGRSFSRVVSENRLAPPRQTPIPRWVTALDAACLVLLAVLIRSWVGDGYDISLAPGLRLSMNSWPRLAAWLALLLTVRHLAWRVIPWHARVYGWTRSLLAWEPLRAAWPPFVTSRLMVLVAGYVAVATIGFDVEPHWRGLDNDWLDLYARWDSGWYFTIASLGYPDHFNPQRMNALAFFPGLPLLMRGTGTLLDLNLWIAGILLVVCGFLFGLMYLYRLAVLDLPPDQARASLMFLAFYPFAFCYSAVLTESLFLLAAVAAFYHFRQGQLVVAGCFGLVVGLLRPNGFLLAGPLALLALVPFARSRGWLPGAPPATGLGWPRLTAQLAAASVPIAGMVAYAAYVNSVTGNPFAWAQAQQAWGRAAAEGWNVLEARSALIASQGFSAYARSYSVEIIEAAAAFFALAAVWPITRRFGLAYGLLVATAVLPPLISMGSVSLGRYTAPLFPIFLWLGAAVPAERRPYWCAMFAAGQALLAALFFTWRPPY